MLSGLIPQQTEASMIPCEDATRLTVRIPADIRDWLTGQVKRNASSHSSEIVRALRERMERMETEKKEDK